MNTGSCQHTVNGRTQTYFWTQLKQIKAGVERNALYYVSLTVIVQACHSVLKDQHPIKSLHGVSCCKTRAQIALIQVKAMPCL